MWSVSIALSFRELFVQWRKCCDRTIWQLCQSQKPVRKCRRRRRIRGSFGLFAMVFHFYSKILSLQNIIRSEGLPLIILILLNFYWLLYYNTTTILKNKMKKKYSSQFSTLFFPYNLQNFLLPFYLSCITIILFSECLLILYPPSFPLSLFSLQFPWILFFLLLLFQNNHGTLLFRGKDR